MINTALLPADKDPMGAAIADYFKRHKADRLRVFSSQFDEDEIPVEELFRTEKQMPLLERTALQMATGKILMWVPAAVAIALPCKKPEKRSMPSTFPRFPWK